MNSLSGNATDFEFSMVIHLAGSSFDPANKLTARLPFELTKLYYNRLYNRKRDLVHMAMSMAIRGKEHMRYFANWDRTASFWDTHNRWLVEHEGKKTLCFKHRDEFHSVESFLKSPYPIVKIYPPSIESEKRRYEKEAIEFGFQDIDDICEAGIEVSYMDILANSDCV